MEEDVPSLSVNDKAVAHPAVEPLYDAPLHPVAILCIRSAPLFGGVRKGLLLTRCHSSGGLSDQRLGGEPPEQVID
jgi:hypothetical protein